LRTNKKLVDVHILTRDNITIYVFLSMQIQFNSAKSNARPNTILYKKAGNHLAQVGNIAFDIACFKLLMTNLRIKFIPWEIQRSTQHTEINNHQIILIGLLKTGILL
jgi:hypothetical protein